MLLKILPGLTRRNILIDQTGGKIKCSICCPKCEKLLTLSAYYTLDGVGFRSNNFARHIMTAHKMPTQIIVNHKFNKTATIKRLQRRIRIANKENIENGQQSQPSTPIANTSTATHNNQDNSIICMDTNTSLMDENVQLKTQNVDLRSHCDDLNKEINNLNAKGIDLQTRYNGLLNAQQKMVDEKNKWEHDAVLMKNLYDAKTVENEKMKRTIITLNEEIPVMRNFEKQLREFTNSNQLLMNANKNLQADLVVMKELKVNYDALMAKNDQLVADFHKESEFRMKFEVLEAEHEQLKVNFNEKYDVLLNENVGLKLQNTNSKCNMELLQSNYEKLKEAQQKLYDADNKWRDDSISMQKLYETVLIENEQLKSENKQMKGGAFSMDELNGSLEELNSVDWRQKTQSLETDLNQAQSELYFSQIAYRDVLHSLLDLQGKVRVMARLQPAVDPFKFEVNSRQNRLKCKSRYGVF